MNHKTNSKCKVSNTNRLKSVPVPASIKLLNLKVTQLWPNETLAWWICITVLQQWNQSRHRKQGTMRRPAQEHYWPQTLTFRVKKSGQRAKIGFCFFFCLLLIMGSRVSCRAWQVHESMLTWRSPPVQSMITLSQVRGHLLECRSFRLSSLH